MSDTHLSEILNDDKFLDINEEIYALIQQDLDADIVAILQKLYPPEEILNDEDKFGFVYRKITFPLIKVPYPKF